VVYSRCPKEVALSIFFDLVRGRTHALDETVQKRIMAYHGKAGRRGNKRCRLSNVLEDPRLG
jgi:hypothetical protein